MKKKINLVKLTENELQEVKAGVAPADEGGCCTGCIGGSSAQCCACGKECFA